MILHQGLGICQEPERVLTSLAAELSSAQSGTAIGTLTGGDLSEAMA